MPTIESLIKAGVNLNVVQHEYGSNSHVDGETALEMAAGHDNPNFNVFNFEST